MIIELLDGFYTATCTMQERDLPREAGFTFDRLHTRKWRTKDWKRAATLIDYLDDYAYSIVKPLLDAHEAELSASYSMFADADIPVPYMTNHKGEVLDYLPYQKAGILYAHQREDTLIADSPGLGKTIQAIGLINYEGITSGIIICPSSLKLNWKKEMEKWLVDKSLTVGVAYGNDIPDTDFVIINYDILWRNRDALWAEHWGILIADEAQFASNPKSSRTKAIFGEWYYDKKLKREVRKKWANPKMKIIRKVAGLLRANKRLMLTGTPMMKRPIDMWPIIRDFDPEELGKSYEGFAYNYCDAYENGFGLDVTGGSNLEELNEKLRKSFMVRRLKSNVLKDLPEKTREVVVLPPEGLKKMIKTERDKFTDALAMLDAVNIGIDYKPKMALEEADPGLMLDTMTTILRGDFDREALGELSGGEVEPGFAAYSEARHNLALSKVPMAAEHIKRLVDSGEKVIVFAIHTDVVAAIREQFPTAARIVGGMTPKKVEAEKLRFQGDKDLGIEPEEDCNVIIANIKAGGTGHTLTEATVVVFIEMWSVPGDMEQCEDRAHRIGLEHNVLIQYLVVDGTMDAMTINTLIQRIDMIQRGVDGPEPNGVNDNERQQKEVA
ncbi:DEAD/DEAH box helicase [Sphingobium sp. MK2]|uniref:DEAD/DEAH box helicase n=1 Tax=Sphingobium sp. MK2 TaxID=3116540 RepID=UPI0032E362E3